MSIADKEPHDEPPTDANDIDTSQYVAEQRVRWRDVIEIPSAKLSFDEIPDDLLPIPPADGGPSDDSQ